MNHAERRALWAEINESLQTTFQAAVKERPQREEVVVDPLTQSHEVGWVVFERKALWVAVNLWRAQSHLPALTLKDIERVETLAAGHADYGSKFVLYCTELALGDDNPRP